MTEILTDLITESKQNGAKFSVSGNGFDSVNPPQTLFGYTYWAHMIPPIRPDNTLILGYGSGTVAKLIDLIWNKPPILGVDLFDSGQAPIIIMNAYKFVEDCKDQFDYVCVDLWSDGICNDFVLNDKNFIECLRRITKRFLCLNVPYLPSDESVNHIRKYVDTGFRCDRAVVTGGNVVEWFSV